MDQLVQQCSPVFTNGLLVDMIMKHVVTSGDIHLIQSCRLVARKWNSGVITAVKKLKSPLYRLRLDATNSLEGTPYVQQNGKILHQFLQQMVGDANVNKALEIQPFRISAAKEFFNMANIALLRDCMEQCGSFLVQLDLNFGAINLTRSFHCNFPQQSLPKLRKLAVNFSDSMQQGANLTHQYAANIIYNKLLGVILLASKNLTQLSFSDGQRDTISAPFDFFSLPLPSKIKELEMHCALREDDINAIIRRSLVHLRVLHLEISYVSLVANNSITTLLEKVQQSLEELTLVDRSRTQVEVSNIMQIPLLPQLQLLRSERAQIEISRNDVARLEQKLPLVSKMILKNLPATVLTSITVAATFETVQELTVSAACRPHFRHPGGEVSIGEDLVGRLCSSFPNLKSLDIRFCGDDHDDVSGIRRIFHEMVNLEELVIRAKGQDFVKSGNRWDSLFIGVREADMFELRRDPNLLESLQGNDEGVFPPITNLTGLRSLSLLSEVRNSESKRQQRSLITSVIFTHAFLKMPNLVKLKTTGRFKVPREMVSKWREIGRSIETEPQEPLERPCDDQ